MSRKRTTTLGVITILMIAGAALSPGVRARARKALRPKADVTTRVVEIGAAARERMRAGFARGGVEYPPRQVTLAAFKQERRMEVYAAGADGLMRLVLEYQILGASGRAGPKLCEGDMQVPEGIYGVESLNPNSMYHVALRVAYPSEEDRARAAEDGRTRLGGDIMIHGGAGSVGCLAMGDIVAEELFVLAADVGVDHVEVMICPTDWRVAGATITTDGTAGWLAARYEMLRGRLKSWKSEAVGSCGSCLAACVV